MVAFFDTNILVYAQQDGNKAETARALLAGGGLLSVQVINEFAAVCRRKMGLDWPRIIEAVDDVLATVEFPLPLTLETHRAALTLARDHGLSFYDALIVASAQEAGCGTLYSEDLQHGRKFAGLAIVNPFTA